MQRRRFLIGAIALASAGCTNDTGVAPAGAPSPAESLAPLDGDQKTLLDGTRQIAAKLLRELGAFPPLALALDARGKSLLVTNDVDPQLAESKKIGLLVSKLEALAAKHAIRSVGIVVNGQIDGDDGKRLDAVLLSIEERGAPARGFAVAYKLSGKRVAFAQPQALRARALVFVAR